MGFPENISGKGLDELQRAYCDGKFNLDCKIIIGNRNYKFHNPDEDILFLNQRLQEIGKNRALYVGTTFEITKHQKWKVIQTTINPYFFL